MIRNGCPKQRESKIQTNSKCSINDPEIVQQQSHGKTKSCVDCGRLIMLQVKCSSVVDEASLLLAPSEQLVGLFDGQLASKPLHCVIPFGEGGLIVGVGITEGYTKFLYAMKVVPPKDLRFQEPKVSKCQKLSKQARLFNMLVLGDVSVVSVAD